jgi:hypothetical protein
LQAGFYAGIDKLFVQIVLPCANLAYMKNRFLFTQQKNGSIQFIRINRKTVGTFNFDLCQRCRFLNFSRFPAGFFGGDFSQITPAIKLSWRRVCLQKRIQFIKNLSVQITVVAANFVVTNIQEYLQRRGSRIRVNSPAARAIAASDYAFPPDADHSIDCARKPGVGSGSPPNHTRRDWRLSEIIVVYCSTVR